MTGTYLSHNKRLVTCLLMLFGLGGSVAFSQKNLSGNLNQPKSHVVTVGVDRVTVDDITGFYANDTILLIQMQGVKILTDPGTYGNPDSYYGAPGAHEFLIIQSVNTGTNEIIFRNNIISTYDPLGNVQIIRVPYYNSANITGPLYCDPWDSTAATGGVVALMVGRKLTLSADIDVSGLGFAGGKDTIGSGICIINNQAVYGLEYYPRSFINAGYKGEGVANFTASDQPLSPGFMKGSGPDWTGGGGGNGRYSGGGGGSNGGSGGIGGLEDQFCGPPLGGGSGGYPAVWDPYLQDRIFLGGGGGASTTDPAGSSSNGGKGGGIIIIVADSITGNGGRIVSNGTPGGTAVGTAGAGGGGAGGSIALYIRHYGSTPVKIAAAGGNGGDNSSSDVGGGGGGGGLVYLNVAGALPANVTDSINGGHAGNYIAPSVNNDGAAGEIRPNFLARLNGFLFNTIESSVTGNQVDSICSNTLPPKITGTQPLGGTGPYIYLWEKSYDAAFTTPIPLTNDPDPVNYTPTVVETSTVWYRRTVTDQSVPAIVDISKPVMMIVQQAIQNNVIIANPDTICINSDPAIITQGTPDLTYPSLYLRYVWQDSTEGGTWSSPLTTSDVKEYDPDPAGGLTKTTWYRRTVVSGRCRDNTAVVRFTVLPDLGSNGFTQLYDTICFGGNTELATIAGPTGGLPTDYRYVWQQSVTGLPGSWSSVAGATQAAYDPDGSVPLPAGDHFYRRIVLSGEQDACKDTSGVAARKVWPVITNNSIQADQIIGYDSIPDMITQSAVPAGGAGAGTYEYAWVSDTTGYPAAPGPGATDQADYQPPELRWTRSFSRIVNSSACADTSSPVMITVDAPIINSISLDNTALDTIYTGQASSVINGSVPAGGSANPADGYSFKWYKSTAAVPVESDWTAVTGLETQYDPGNLIASTWFRRDVSSPAVNPRATRPSNLVRVIVLPALVNVGISADQAICSGSRPLRINGDNLLTGGDGIYRFTWQDSTQLHGWQDIAGYVKSDSANYKPPSLTSSSAYRRIVYSGKNDCGVATSNHVMVVVNPMPGMPDAGQDQTIYSINRTIRMDAVPPLAGETGEWKVLDSDGATVVDPSKYDTEIRNLLQGTNNFLWTVTTDIGQCSLSDTVNIFLNKDFVPRAFSPNGDGVNDRFIIEGLNLSENIKIELKILNGAGSVVFSTSNASGETWEDWDGRDTRGKDLPEGTYYYLFKMTTGDRVDMKTGFIILKRN